MTQRSASRLLVLLTVVTVLVTACTQPVVRGPATHEQSRLVVGATAPPPTMDPIANEAAAIPQVLLYNVYETLVKLDNEGRLRPLLAQRWGVSPDGRTYTFHIDPAAKFASGRRVSATDAVWSIDRIKNSASAEVLKNQMSVVESARAVDEGTLEVTLNRPSNMWLYDMSSTAGMVFDSQAGVDFATETAGSGPYLLSEWVPGSAVTLAINPNYWGTPGRFEQVVFRYFTDSEAMNAAMLAGELDIISDLASPAALPQFSDPARFRVIEGTTNGEVVLAMNNKAPGLSDVRVRQAIRSAIDKQALVNAVWGGKGALIGAMVPPTDPWFEDRTGDFPYDPARAKALLAEAGAQNLRLRLRVPTLPYATAAAQVVQTQLRAVGIETDIDELEFPDQWNTTVRTNGDYDLSIMAHVEPRDLVRFADPNDYFHYDSSEFARLVREADEGTPADQVPKLQQAARLMSQDAAADWLFLLPNLVITKPNITGVPKNATTLSFDLTTIAAA